VCSSDLSCKLQRKISPHPLYFGSDHLPVICDFEFGTSTSILENHTFPKKLTLYSNYPNPFNSITNIRFYLPEAANIKIDLFNATGKKIQTVLNSFKTVGEHNIKFSLEKANIVSLNIYDTAGRVVKTLYNNKKLAAGELHKVSWNGTNTLGTSVASGTYFYRLVAGDNVSVKKMILLH